MKQLSSVTKDGNLVDHTYFEELNGIPQPIGSFCSQCGWMGEIDPCDEVEWKECLEEVPCPECEMESLHPIMTDVDREVAGSLNAAWEEYNKADDELSRLRKLVCAFEQCGVNVENVDGELQVRFLQQYQPALKIIATHLIVTSARGVAGREERGELINAISNAA